MIAAALGEAGEFIRCITCGAPGAVAATDLPPVLGIEKRVAAYCRPCAVRVCETARRSALVVDRQLAVAVLRMVQEIEAALPPEDGVPA